MATPQTTLGTRVELAVREFGKAKRLQRRPAFDRLDAITKPVEAERASAEGERLLVPPDNVIGRGSGELVPGRLSGESMTAERMHLLDTLAEPDMVGVDASDQRVSLATRAGILSPALDTAATANAANSIEKMLCHQLAGLHHAGMQALVRLEGAHRLPPVELARITNATARLFEVYQTGCLALQKLKAGGTQHMLIEYQQVNVSAGGQAIVAAQLDHPRVSRGRRRGK